MRSKHYQSPSFTMFYSIDNVLTGSVGDDIAQWNPAWDNQGGGL